MLMSLWALSKPVAKKKLLYKKPRTGQALVKITEKKLFTSVLLF